MADFFIDYADLKQVRLIDIVTAIDGNRVYTACGLGLEKCDEHAPCPLHFEFVEVRERLGRMLNENTLHNILYTRGKMNEILLRL